MFGRKKKAEAAAVEAESAEVEETETKEEFDISKSAPADRAENGPFDLTEVPEIKPYIDLGAIKLAPRTGLAVRLDVEEETGRIIAVSVDFEGSTMQIQAFAAPKNSGLWREVHAYLEESLTEQGFAVTAGEGTFGPELIVRPGADAAPAEGPQALRFIGVDGPRWMVRGVIMGDAADNADAAAGIESVFRELVIVRGDFPMPPSELLPLHAPEGLPVMREEDLEDESA